MSQQRGEKPLIGGVDVSGWVPLGTIMERAATLALRQRPQRPSGESGEIVDQAPTDIPIKLVPLPQIMQRAGTLAMGPRTETSPLEANQTIVVDRAAGIVSQVPTDGIPTPRDYMLAGHS